MAALRATFLGRPAFSQGGKAVACASRKSLWLAAYVLLVPGVHSRTKLASLLWSGDSPRHALGSLRVALTKLPAPVLACLEVTRETIARAPGVAIENDVEEFTACCAAEDAAAGKRAVALYAGVLLQGAEEEATPEFGDWLLAERARLKQLAHQAHLRLAQRLAAHGERERAREVAEAWLRHEPASEEMHRLVMGWLTSDQALAHYEVYRRARAVSLGAAPSEAMAALAERLRHGAAERQSREAPARLTAATSFIGRADELAELRALLGDPACRLLTIHGMGGVGKTRLAGALAEMEAATFADGVHVVALEGVASPALFAQTLARACGLQPAGSTSPLDLVASFLAERSVLVLIDNLEHLLDAADDPDSLPAQVAQLLRATGGRVKVLATSREPLRLQEEWLYELSGLAHSREEANGDAQGYPAVQFFAQRARQAYVGFSLAAELPNVLRICALLEGLPLGLELAASWVRTVPCAEIAAGLDAQAKELRSRHVNRAARHDSLASVVAYSWDRLPLEQREALSGLAALRGTFSREAAEFVAHAGLRTLSALTEKSLLQRAAGGRWHLHEVVRQFAWEQPDAAQRARPSRQAAACKRRDTFFMEFLRSARARLDGETEAEGLSAIEAEASNIREAWQSCARGGALDVLEAAAPVWFEFLEARSFVAEGIAAANRWLEAARAASHPLSTARALTRLGLFQRFAAQTAQARASLDEAIALLEPRGATATADLAQARVARAFTLFLMGELDAAEREADVVMVLAESAAEPVIVAGACRVKGLALMQSGRREQGRDLQRRALEVAMRIGKPSLQAAAHNNLALSENHLGNFRAAEAGYQAALGIWRELHMTVNVGRAMHNLGVVSRRMGDLASALDRYRAALEVLLKAGERNLIALNLMSTGDVLVRLGRADEARAPTTQALRMAERDGHMLPALDAHIVLAQSDVALGDHADAARHLATALDGARDHHFANVVADAVVATARLIAAATPGEAADALAWASEIARLPDTSVSVRADAIALVGESGGKGAATRTLDEVALEARAALATFSARRAARAPVP